MKRFLPFLVLCLAIVITLSNMQTALAQRSPLVLAFYYDWFDENTWSPSKVPDRPSPLYVSRDPGAMARQIQQARSAGIDAFVISWWGAGNPTDDNFKVMLGQASAANFRLAVDFELTSPFYNSKDDVIHSLKNLLANNAQHPAYLRVDSKPVIFFWREQKYSVDEWRAIRDQVDPNRQSIWIAEGVKEQLPYLSVFDGFHLYSIAWAPDVTAELQKWSPRVKAYGADKTWAATVMPGADNSKSPQSEKVIRDRRGGDFYRETWGAAFSTYPDWIIITSWNEWVEGTMIEPSVSYGNLFLDITRGFAAQFHAGLPTPTPTPTKTPKPTVTATLTPTMPLSIITYISGTGVLATISDTLRVRALPSNDSDILGRLRQGMTVTLLARTNDSQWWLIPYPDPTQRGWIFSGFINPNGDLSTLPILSGTITPALMQTIGLSNVMTQAKLSIGMRTSVSDTVQVRSAPSMNAEVLGYLGEGSSITLVARSDDGLWWQIPYLGGDFRGWVFYDYINPASTQDTNSAASNAPTPTLLPTSTFTPTQTSTPVPDTATPTSTAMPKATPTRTPAPGFSFPSLKDIFPFLP